MITRFTCSFNVLGRGPTPLPTNWRGYEAAAICRTSYFVGSPTPRRDRSLQRLAFLRPEVSVAQIAFLISLLVFFAALICLLKGNVPVFFAIGSFSLAVCVSRLASRIRRAITEGSLPIFFLRRERKHIDGSGRYVKACQASSIT